jgi:ssDNA-binding Zn-finger/Zn-ribbon topoisomerase 1
MSKRKEPKEPVLRCPECGSDQVTVSHLQRFMANSGDHYCHSVKTHDSNSQSTCINCNWTGERKDLAAHGIKGATT